MAWLSAVVGLLMAGGYAAGQVPLGSAEFKPSAERPVGWRGDGTGHFPGATPPVSWERKRQGQRYATKGIAWAAQLPNGGLSSPIVVGDRVFVTSEPQDLVCLDKGSGKILWIRSLLEFEGLPQEERTAEPAFAEKVAPLAEQLAAANGEVVEALNAGLPEAAATTPAYQVLPAMAKKRGLEKQIQEAMNGIDKKKFDHAWPQAIYGYCTETPTSDGKNVCVFISTGIAACFDLEGNRKWIARGANGGEEKGHYTSPLMVSKQFVVWGNPEMRGYDVETGKVLWTTPAKGSNTHSLYRIDVQGEQVAALGTYYVRVRDGQAIWKSKMYASALTPIVEGGMVYGNAGDRGGFTASQVPASTESGTVTPKVKFKIDWDAEELPKTKERPFDRGIIASPLLVDGLIYQISSGGGLVVNDAATGEMVYRKVLPMQPHTAYWAWGGACVSPALAGKNIYLWDNQGTTVIIEPGREYKELAVNKMEETLSANSKEQDQNLACPWFDGGRIYYRTPGYLYCIGQ